MLRILYIKYESPKWPDYFKPIIRVGYFRTDCHFALYFMITIEEWMNQGGE